MELMLYEDLIRGNKGVGVPFKAGGRNLDGMDCKGVAWTMLRRFGMDVPDYEPDDNVHGETAEAYLAGYLSKGEWVPVKAGEIDVGDLVVSESITGGPHVSVVVERLPVLKIITALTDFGVVVLPYTAVDQVREVLRWEPST